MNLRIYFLSLLPELQKETLQTSFFAYSLLFFSANQILEQSDTCLPERDNLLGIGHWMKILEII